MDALLAVTIATSTLAALSTAALTLAVRSSRQARGQAEARARDAGQALRMLRTAMDAAPAATVLLSDLGVVVLTNAPARDMFAEGKELEGQNFLTLLGNAPAAFREALVGEEDALFTVGGDGGGGESDGESEGDTFRLTKRHVELDERTCMLLTVEQVTRQVRRQEVEVWKKLLRTISHELNNSLAPISSLVHSARVIAGRPDAQGKLARVFDTIEERTNHLQEFLEGYVRFARLPRPRPQKVAWSTFLGRVREMFPLAKIEEAPAGSEGWFDPVQLEQVLLNLLKNAEESGSRREDVMLAVVPRDDGGFDVCVSDRGPGMSREVLDSALLPFYSTKERGTGLGLALCREIIESHGGKIRLQNRDGGGLVVTCSLSAREVRSSPAAKITLTQG